MRHISLHQNKFQHYHCTGMCGCKYVLRILITLTPGSTGRREEVALQIQEVAPTDSRGGPHHVCGVSLCSVWHLVPFKIRQTLARSWDTSLSSRHQACSAGRRNDCAINMSTEDTGVQEFRSTGDTGVQEIHEYRRYRSTRCLVKI